MALRVKLPLLLSLVACAGSLYPASACAQQSIKEKLADNCEGARVEFIALPREQQENLLEYLTRVIALNTEAPNIPGAFLPPTGGVDPSLTTSKSKSFEFGQLPALQALNAERILREKRCALTLLQSAGGNALNALPGLSEVYSSQQLSDEIGVQLEEVAADIAEAAHLTGRILSDQQIATIIPHLRSANSTVARSILTECNDAAVPLVVQQLFAEVEDPAATGAYAKFLAEADPSGALSMRGFTARVTQSPDVVARKVFPLLPPRTTQVDTLFSPDAVRWTIDPEHGGLGRRALTERCSGSAPVTFEETSAKLLEGHSEILLSPEISEATAACLLRAVPGLRDRLPPLFGTSATEADLIKLLHLLSAALPSAPQSTRDALFGVVKERSFDPRTTVATHAIEQLPIFSDRRADVLRILFQVIKSTEKRPEKDTVTALLTSVFKAATTLSPGDDTARFTPYLVAAFEHDQWSPSAATLAARISDASVAFAKLLTPQLPVGQTRRILELFAESRNLSKKVIPTLLTLLPVAEVSFEAERALSRASRDTATMLRAQIKKLSPKENERTTQHLTRVALLAVLANMGVATLAEVTELMKALAHDGCGQLRGRAETILASVTREDLDPTLRDTMAGRIRECITKVDLGTARTFIQQAPHLSLPPLQQTLGFFALPDGSPDLGAIILEQALSNKLSAPDRRAIIDAALASQRRPWLVMVLEHLQPADGSNKELLSKLRDLAKSSRDDTDLQSRTVRVLATLGDTEYDWRAFVRKAILRAADGGDISFELTIIPLIPAEITEQELRTALTSEKLEKILGGCRIAPALGARAAPIIPQLWLLKQRREPAIRYSAALALLAVNPLSPELSPLLKAILVNRYFADALKATVPWPTTVAVLELQREELGQLRKLRLERLRG